MNDRMRNDIHLTRAILASIRDREDCLERAVEMPGHDPLLVARHAGRLYDDGYIDGMKIRMTARPDIIAATDLGTAGHAFPAHLESGDVWTRLTTALSPAEIGSMTMCDTNGGMI